MRRRRHHHHRRRVHPKDLPPPASFGPPENPGRFVLAPDALKAGRIGHGSFGAVVFGVDTGRRAAGRGDDEEEREEDAGGGSGSVVEDVVVEGDDGRVVVSVSELTQALAAAAAAAGSEGGAEEEEPESGEGSEGSDEDGSESDDDGSGREPEHFGLPVAIKLEVAGTSTARNEVQMMRRIMEACVGEAEACGGDLRLVPPIYAGDAGEHHVAIVMPLLGVSVSDFLYDAMRRREGVPPGMALAVAIQAAEGMRQLHRAGLVHRDVKPGNMVFGPAGSRREHRVFLVDFGLTEPWEPVTKREEARRAERGLGDPHVCGTAKYASRNTHAGVPPSPRDDLESLCYMLISHLRAPEKLPWEAVIGLDKKQRQQQGGHQQPRNTHGNDFRRAARVKLETKARALCKGLEPEVLEVLCRVRNTKFDEMPDHEGLIALLRRAMTRTCGETCPEEAVRRFSADVSTPTAPGGGGGAGGERGAGR